MGIFSNIMAKLGFGNTNEEAVANVAATAAAPEATAAIEPISVVDVVAKLEGMAAPSENMRVGRSP